MPRNIWIVCLFVLWCMSNRDIEGMFHVTNTLFTIPLFKCLEDHYVIKRTIILRGCIMQNACLCGQDDIYQRHICFLTLYTSRQRKRPRSSTAALSLPINSAHRIAECRPGSQGTTIMNSHHTKPRPSDWVNTTILSPIKSLQGCSSSAAGGGPRAAWIHV